MLYLDKFKGADFKYDNSFCSNSSPKASKKFYDFLQNFVLDKFEGVYFKYDNIFFNQN